MRHLKKINPTSALLCTLLLLCVLISSASAESLFEQYASKNATELNAETHAMGHKLKSYFSAENIQQKQQQIDFSEYHSNFKKVLLYSISLSTYSEYERDLQFARDKEIFKGLPIGIDETQGDEAARQRHDFMGKKYLRMQKNVEEEVATYSDLLLLSLETCENLTRQDLSGILDNNTYVDEMRDFLHSETVQRYQKRQPQLTKRWPELNQRIADQIALWQRPAVKANAPIIDAQIVEAL